MVTIERRFCGPSDSANGGYACGVAAAQLPDGQGPIEVTLRSPPPLDTPLEVERAGERTLLRQRDQLVAEVVRTSLTLDPPAPVSFDEATPIPHSRAAPPSRAHEWFASLVRR